MCHGLIYHYPCCISCLNKETKSSKTTGVQLQVTNIYLRSKTYQKTLVGHSFTETGLAEK